MIRTTTALLGFFTALPVLVLPGLPAEGSTVAYYGFSGDAMDVSGNGNHATVSGATLTADRHGNPNQAYLFDGSDIISTPLLRQTYQEDFSISLWYRYDGGLGDYYRPLVGGQFGPFFLGKEAGNSNISMQNGNHVPSLAPGTNAWDGSWHHLVAVFDGTSPGSALTGTVYLDTVPVGTSAYTNASSAAGLLYIGHEVTIPTVYFLGAIDDVGFYDHALSVGEIGALFAIPEPSRGLLALASLGVIGLRRRRR